MRYLAVAAIFAFMIPGASLAAPALTSIKPSVVDPGIDPAYDSPNEVGAPTARARGRLFVFLPGSGVTPAQYMKIVQEALRQGFNAIGLEYPNGTSIQQLCQKSHAAACPSLVRNDTITGKMPNRFVKVQRRDSIAGRLISLLGYLAQHDPNGHWSQYLSDGSIVWSRVVVGGHSQGAGNAAYIGKLFNVAGLCDFDSPVDVDPTAPTPLPAPWLSGKNVTPVEREFGFTNKLDRIAPYAQVVADWNAIPIPAKNQLTITA
ncbi:MAG: hypothetical protein IAI50_06420, partial [Candidatus Eremiobacteraeota bacterium]|nr:hypothetical protein [Candidatus Eremiobacteraeota bacterium]